MLFGIYSFYNISNEIKQLTLSSYNLKGKVKSIYERMDSLDIKSIAHRKHSRHINFDERGQETSGFDTDNIMGISSVKNVFDEQGRIIEYTYYRGSFLIGRATFTYTSQGHLNEQRYYEHGSCISTFVYKYDTCGNLSEEDVFNARGSLSAKDISIYNSENIRIQRRNLTSKGKLTQGTIYTPDEKGNIVKEEDIQADETVGSRIATQYDTSGKVIRIDTYDGPHNGYGQGNSLLEYDSTGNLIEKNTIYFMKKLNRHQSCKDDYKYDEKGNWVIDKRYYNDTLVYVLNRSIEYY
jgi:hypothetical protein